MSEEKGTVGGVTEFCRRSPLLRILLVGVLVLLLQIPINMISGVVGERENRRQEAESEVTSKWGDAQTVIGPMLTVPYVQKWYETDKDGAARLARTEVLCSNFLPDTLQVTGQVDGETRYRGIFKVPVYSMGLDVSGQFTRPDFSEWGVKAEDILWDRAHLTVQVSDARAITNQAAMRWNGQPLQFLPGVGDFGGKATGIHVPMKGQLTGETFKFSFHLDLNGSGGVSFAPFGRDTTVELGSNWSDPSFQGNWLPAQRAVSEKGFVAKWSIPFLGRNYPQKWQSSMDFAAAISSSTFGVCFIAPVDHYRMSARSVKYEVLFLSLTFLTLWLFERLSQRRVHSVQYLLVGAGVCVFYLLELALAEHIGFAVAYVCASAAVTAIVTLYCLFVLGGRKGALIMGGVLALLYAYLYVLLMCQDYALLIGSVCLFLALAVVMWITRKVDWYSVGN